MMYESSSETGYSSAHQARKRLSRSQKSYAETDPKERQNCSYNDHVIHPLPTVHSRDTHRCPGRPILHTRTAPLAAMDTAPS